MNWELNEKNASSLRRYIYEFCIMGLSASVVILFIALSSLNKDVRTVLMELVVKNNVIIQDNSNALRDLRVDLNNK